MIFVICINLCSNVQYKKLSLSCGSAVLENLIFFSYRTYYLNVKIIFICLCMYVFHMDYLKAITIIN